MIIIGEFGWKIKIYKAATVVGVMLGVRDSYDSTEAMFHHSLFSDWLHENGMTTDKRDESTRDIICMDYQFGLRSYEEEKAHIKDMRKKAQKIKEEEEKNKRFKVIDELEQRIDSRKNKYKKMSKDEIREYTYVNGIYIDYPQFNKQKEIVGYDRIYYRYLYRNPSMAKTGKCMFINIKLYDSAYEHISMGLGPKLPKHNAKIVEISAYIPLLASSIEGTVHIPIEDVLILKDQDSFFKTIADVIRTEDYQVYEQVKGKKTPELVTKKKCVVHRDEIEVVNTLWDGMALIETSIMPEWCNGMALLRMHFFKACAFRTRLQEFIKDYCAEHGIDYETYEVEDMFGHKHLMKNIKLVSTNNATKFLKLKNLMGGTDVSAYEYWCEWVKKDGDIWGIVKTDHVSKLGEYQQQSYQACNSLPTTKEDMMKIAETSMNYVSALKNDDEVFIDYLRRNANYVNSNEMLADLYEWNHEIAKSKMFKEQKKSLIKEYVIRLKKGKIIQIGDNMTVCGNPYGLLLHMVGEDWNNDPTLLPEEGTIQVYCPRFDDGEFLCGIRSPHNSSNNLGYFHNTKHPLMERYFEFSNNIMAVNCIHTDIMARMNGMDFDSDFNYVTNQPEIVKAAKYAYENYPTVVNEVPESGKTYDNTPRAYAVMDSAMQSCQRAIGGSSDTAQLCQSYMFDKIYKNELDDDYQTLYEDVIVLAVLAQLAIDSCKKAFEIDVTEEIKRIRGQKCMNREKDFPKFMAYTHKIAVTKNGKERPYEDIKKDKRKVQDRIDETIECPMNWMHDCLDKIQGAKRETLVDTMKFLVPKPKKQANAKQMAKIAKLVEEYDGFIKSYIMSTEPKDGDDVEIVDIMKQKTEELYAIVSEMRITEPTMHRLISCCLGYEGGGPGARIFDIVSKHSLRMLNILYNTNRERFLSCFTRDFVQNQI